ncbi:hypothetical protein [Xanthobacter autotrophicus]|uniref:hypothetical protein n=1 Tax=Xanthobacter autotrophicus TaxID=280 RepID=UPI00372ACFC8
MNKQRFILVHNGSDKLALTALLRRVGHEVITVEGFGKNSDDEAEAARVLMIGGLFDCMVLAPPVPEGTGSTAVADTLCRSFALIKTALAVWGPDMDGRIVVLLSSEATMGDPSNPAGSALAGAMLSLSRTVALECRKGRNTINTIMFDPMERNADAVALQIGALAHPASRSVSGQEIFAAGASDVGRLHP